MPAAAFRIPSSPIYAGTWRAISDSGIVGRRSRSTLSTPITVTGTVTDAPASVGLGAKFNGSSILRAPLVKGLPASRQISLLVVCRTTATTISQWIAGLGSESGSAGNTLFGLATGSANANGLHLHAGGASANIASSNGFDTLAFSLNNGRWHVLLATVDLTVGATRARVFADGVLVGSYTGTDNVGTLTYSTVCMGGTRRGATNLLGFVGDIALVQPIYRFLTDAEAIALTEDPFRLFAQPDDFVFIQAPSGITLAGDPATGAGEANTGSITQTHALAGSQASGAPTANTGTITQAHFLTGAAANGQPTATTGAITQTHVLTGSAANGQPAATTGAITQTHILTGQPASGTGSADTGAITLDSSVTLAGQPASSTGAANTGAIVQRHLLSGNPASSQPTADTGAIIQRHMLVGAPASCVGAANTGVIVTSLGLGAIHHPSLIQATPLRRLARSTPQRTLWRAA